MIVLDASLATKLVLLEDGSAAALDFATRYDGQLAGPDLLLTEVCGAIVRHANQDKRFAGVAVRALERWTGDWDAGVIAAHRVTAPLVARAATLAMELGHPLADCIYLALAEQLDCDLATCDEKFCRKAAPRFGRVRLLHQFDD